MVRVLAAACAALAVVGGLVAPRTSAAQTAWNDPRTRALIERATQRRAQQLADTGLVDYQSTAHGYLTFLAQVGEGFPDPPKIVKADELALEVYWRAPDLSKQRIVGRRDTLLLPTDINYHRDHLGIVQNNFPNIIRLGDGDEVRDVPHPLSRDGLVTYDYAINDSLRIQLPDRSIEVYEVKVRPRDDRQAAAVGAVYIDRAEGQVVRMAFSFTRAALRDKQLEDVSIVIENALIEGRFWLPRRQEIEIRRTGTWLEYPARGIIRGRWEICCYRVNRALDRGFFVGPEIVQAPPQQIGRYPWRGAVLDSLPPDVRAATDADVKRVQDEARSLVRAEALARGKETSLAARSISDFVRINRVEGLSLGLGVASQLGAGFATRLRGRFGIDDHQARGEFGIGWQRANGRGVRVIAYRALRDAGDEPETSTLRNSIAAQEFGSDYTDPIDARGVGAELSLGRLAGTRWRLNAAFESQRSVSVNAVPSRGIYAPTLDARPLEGPRITLAATLPPSLSVAGTEVKGQIEIRWVRAVSPPVLGGPRTATFGRVHGSTEMQHPILGRTLLVRTTAAATIGPDLPRQEFVYLGGPTSGLGYEFHEFTGQIGISQHIELHTTIPFVPIGLGRFGSTGRSATLAPFAHVVYVTRTPDGASRGSGWYPAVGSGLLWLFDLLRLDVARGLRDGRWTLGVDVMRDFWGIL
jgi:hypothetical protein